MVARLVPSAVILAVAAASFAELTSSLTAMACCAKTHNECAGLKSPDDCCKGMGHTVAASTLATVTASKANPSAKFTAIGPTLFALNPAVFSRVEAHGTDWKRPHDPPHLHPFPLLI
jgi:hypothetical protein